MMDIVVATIEDIKHFSNAQLLQAFIELDAPTVGEMNGEFQATLLKQPSLIAGLTGAFTVKNPLMPWLCKAFRPVDAEHGRGYNTFKKLGRVVQRYPMETLIAPSRYDGRPAYQLVYRAYRSTCGDIHMVDEVRKIAPCLYLGIGTFGFSKAQRRVPLPFLLEGPVADYRGDIGKPRKNYAVESEIPGMA